jgi:hypothetical protein
MFLWLILYTAFKIRQDAEDYTMTHEFIAPTYSYTHDTVSFRNSQNQPINGEIDQVNF